MLYIVARLFEVEIGFVLLPDKSYNVSKLVTSKMEGKNSKLKLTQIP
jgi:hypothetical protein